MELDKKIKERHDRIEAENRWIAEINAELDMEKQQKLDKKLKQIKESVKKQSSRQTSENKQDKQYDVQCLQMQDELLRSQEEKRNQEKKAREDKVNLRMQIFKCSDQQNQKEKEYELKVQNDMKQKEAQEMEKFHMLNQKVKNDKEQLRRVLQKQIFEKEQHSALERVKDGILAKEICEIDERDKDIEDQKIKASKDKHIQNNKYLDLQIEHKNHKDEMDAREFSINKQLFKEMEKIEEMIKNKKNDVETNLIFSPY